MSGVSKAVVKLERAVVFFVGLGVIFKLFHWPGASVLVVSGGIIFIAAVIIKIYKNFINTEKTRKEKVANFLTIISGVLIATSIIFKQQHYPFAKNLFYLGTTCFVGAILLTNWRLELQKRHIVISAIFIFWVLISLIFTVEHLQYKPEIISQINDLRQATQNQLASVQDSTRDKVELRKFFSTVDGEIENILKLHFSDSTIIYDSVYPSNIPYPSSDLFGDLAWGNQGLKNITLSYQNIAESNELDSFSEEIFNISGTDIIETRNDELNKNEKIEIPKVLTNSFFDGTFIFYSWYLESLKLELANYFLKSKESSDLVKLTRKTNEKLQASIISFYKRQKQLQDSLIAVTILLILTLYLDRIGLKQRYQKPLIFFAVFAFLEFILLTADPVLQLYIENGYLVSALEVGLAALVIPFHSMVEHNLYQNQNQNEPERP